MLQGQQVINHGVKKKLAYEAVLESGLSVSHAAEEYDIPKSTLTDIVSGRRLMGCRSGPPSPRLLSDAQEEYAKSKWKCSSQKGILEETLDEYDIKESPNFIYNMDETSMPFEPKLPKGIFARGEQNPSVLSSGNKDQLTVVACTNAAGFCIPPMIIIDRKNLSQPFCDGEVPGTRLYICT